MPQITEYTAPENIGLRPTEVGVHATEAAARRVGGAYSEAAQTTKEAGQRIGAGIAAAGEQVAEWQARKEISQGAAAYAGLMNEKTKQWHETNTNADPNDPTVAKNFQASVEADLAKFKSGFLTQKGQDWAEAHVQSARNHFFLRSAADRSTAAGQAVQVNAEHTVNGHANAAYWSGGTQEGVDKAMGDLRTSGLNAKTVEEGLEKVVTNGVLGGIRANSTIPEWAKDAKYSKYLDAAKLDALKKAEEHQQKYDSALAKQQEAQTKRENTQAVESAAQENENKNSTFDPATNRYVYTNDYLKNAKIIQGMPEGLKTGEAMIAKVQRQQDKKPPPLKDNPEVHDDILNRLTHQTDRPVTNVEIDVAEAKDQLTSASAKKLKTLQHDLTVAPIKNDPMTVATLDAVKKLIGTDAVGKEKYAGFIHNFVPQYLALPADKRPGALNLEDKNSLVSQTMQPLIRDFVTRSIDQKLGGSELPGVTDQEAPGIKAAPPGTPGYRFPDKTAPPAGSLWNAARQQYKYPDGTIHDLTGKSVETGVRQ